MTTGYVVNLDNGHNGFCVERIPGVTHCGEAFSPVAVDREVFEIEERDRDHPHTMRCIDCLHADSHELREASRGEVA